MASRITIEDGVVTIEVGKGAGFVNDKIKITLGEAEALTMKLAEAVESALERPLRVPSALCGMISQFENGA